MDPFSVTVRCMYASDGHSHRRDDHGCGPYSVDPAYGSRGETQLRASGQLDTTRRSLLSGLANTSADAIDCADYYGINLGGSSPNVTAFHPINEGPRACERMKRDGTFVVEAATAAWQRMDAAIAGQPVCTPNDAMHAMSGQFWVYTGACSWAPTEWQSMADIFVNHLLPASEDVPDGAEARHLWNEIIARAPQDAPAERASTLAMFYIRTDNATEVSELRELAMTNADALGVCRCSSSTLQSSQVAGRFSHVPCRPPAREGVGDAGEDVGAGRVMPGMESGAGRVMPGMESGDVYGTRKSASVVVSTLPHFPSQSPRGEQPIHPLGRLASQTALLSSLLYALRLSAATPKVALVIW